MLQAEQSRQRQKRLLTVLNDSYLDAVVLGLSHHVYWISAYRQFWLSEAAFILFADGRSCLIAASTPNDAAADNLITFEGNWMGTQRQEQPAVVAEKAANQLKGPVRRMTFPECSMPASGILEQAYYPGPDTIAARIKSILNES